MGNPTHRRFFENNPCGPRGTPQERQIFNDATLREGRKKRGRVELRILPQVRRTVGRSDYVGFRGHALRLNVPEPVDAWEFVSDLALFVKAWRPLRLRNEGNRIAAQKLLATWKNLGEGSG